MVVIAYLLKLFNLWGPYKSAQIAALSLLLRGAAVEERRSTLWGNSSHLVSSAAAHLLRRRSRWAAVDKSIHLDLSTASRLLRCRSRWEVAAPQLAAPVAAPVRISSQYEHFYTTPTSPIYVQFDWDHQLYFFRYHPLLYKLSNVKRWHIFRSDP